MSCFKDLYCGLDLDQKLVSVPPRITIASWINHFASITDDAASFIQKNQLTILLIDKIRNIDKSVTPLLKPLFAFSQPGLSSISEISLNLMK
jgi:hypothetical protein